MDVTLVCPRELLTELRKQHDLLQQDVADRLDRPQGFDFEVESGIRRLDVVEVLDFLRALEADPHDFIEKLISGSASSLPR
ncbi:helix-turn-helix transcriptional regulator [Mycetohabitans rhizoxinica]